MRIVFYSILIIGIIGVITGITQLFAAGRDYYGPHEADYHECVNGVVTSLTIVGGALLFLWLL